METQPHAYMRGSRSALLLYSVLALKITQVSIRKFGSITLLLPERISPHSDGKGTIIFRNNKE